MQKSFIILAATLLSLSTSSIGAPESAYPGARVRDYVELAVPGHGLGTLRLSNKFASFQELPGHSDIKYAGQLPSNDSEFAGSQIYQVLNGRKFFPPNTKSNRVCNKPLKWLGVVEERDDPSIVWITLFQIDDYRTYDAASPGLCAAFAYRLL